MTNAPVLSDSAQPTIEPEQSVERDAAEVLGSLFKAHHQLIWRTVRRLGASPEAAADFTQQAFVIAAERFEQIRPGCERAFVFSTAIGLSRTAFRRERRCQLEDDMERHFNDQPREPRLMERHYARQVMQHILDRLDSDLVTVFTLFELEGFSSPEISHLLEVPLGTVASRLRRARALFKAEVANLEQGSGEEQ